VDRPTDGVEKARVVHPDGAAVRRQVQAGEVVEALPRRSPVFVAALLTRVSGIPLLERKADATWGGQADYEAYKQRTGVLLPRLGRR